MRARGSLLVLAVGVAALGMPKLSSAQESGKISRIGVLSGGATSSPGYVVFVQALRERGYIEGQNLTTIYRYAEGQVERLPQLAGEVVGAKADVIVTVGNAATIAAKKATGSIPIVAATSDDPVAAGLAVLLAHPGGNVTGVVTLSRELSGKRLEVLKEMLPRVSRIGMLTAPGSVRQAEAMQAAARSLGVHLVQLDARTADEVNRGFERAQKERMSAIIVLASPVFGALRPQVLRLAAQHRLPALYPGRPWVEAGGLVAYGPDIDREAFSRAALLVDRILKGARPADLPFEQLTKIELVVNAKTARALGLTIPPSILARADVIE